ASRAESNLREALRAADAQGQGPGAGPAAPQIALPARPAQGPRAVALLQQKVEQLALAQQRATGPMIVRTASVTLSTDTFDTMRAAIEALIATQGGRIGALSVTGEPASGRALHATL